MVDQSDLVHQLREIASYERGYRQQAFDNAALAISALSKSDFENYINSGKFMSIRGVGKSVEKCIVEYITEGKIKRLEEHKSNGSEAFPFFNV